MSSHELPLPHHFYMNSDRYDLIVIGAGAAGSTAAETAAQAGRRVALVERDRLGGTCLNYGCDPTKTLRHIARRLFQARHAEGLGLRIPHAEADWGVVQARVGEVVEAIRGGTEAEARAGLATRGITLWEGEARFVDPHTVEVGGERLRGAQIIVAAGTRPLVPPIPGLAEAGFITNTEAVWLPELPRRLAIVGGGPIGVEFAQLFHRFGVQVTLLGEGDRLLPRDDRALAERLEALLRTEGIAMHLGIRAEEARCEAGREGKRLIFGAGTAQQNVEVDEILLATGRQPALEALNLEAAGVEVDPKRGIPVRRTLRTNRLHIWAAGDVVAGGFPFTHVAAAQGELAARNALARKAQPWDATAIPWATYTDPELAHVGQTEAELQEAGTPYHAHILELDQVDRARIEGETAGLVKLLVSDRGRLLGGHILAPDAGSLLAPLVLAMRHGLTVRQIADTILPYPTLAEAVRWAAGQVVERS